MGRQRTRRKRNVNGRDIVTHGDNNRNRRRQWHAKEEKTEKVIVQSRSKNAHHRDKTNEMSSSSDRSRVLSGVRVVAHSGRKSDGNVKVQGARTRVKRKAGQSTSSDGDCNKNVWVENFVYNPSYTLKWRFSQSELQKLNENITDISFR